MSSFDALKDNLDFVTDVYIDPAQLANAVECHRAQSARGYAGNVANIEYEGGKSWHE